MELPFLIVTFPLCVRWWQLPYYWAGIKIYDLVAGAQCLKSHANVYYIVPYRTYYILFYLYYYLPSLIFGLLGSLVEITLFMHSNVIAGLAM